MEIQLKMPVLDSGDIDRICVKMWGEFYWKQSLAKALKVPSNYVTHWRLGSTTMSPKFTRKLLDLYVDFWYENTIVDYRLRFGKEPTPKMCIKAFTTVKYTPWWWRDEVDFVLAHLMQAKLHKMNFIVHPISWGLEQKIEKPTKFFPQTENKPKPKPVDKGYDAAADKAHREAVMVRFRSDPKSVKITEAGIFIDDLC